MDGKEDRIKELAIKMVEWHRNNEAQKKIQSPQSRIALIEKNNGELKLTKHLSRIKTKMPDAWRFDVCLEFVGIKFSCGCQCSKGGEKIPKVSRFLNKDQEED